MAVENYFLSREGRILSNRILKFMRSLIIKIVVEANEEETKETYLAWLAYKYAYEGTDDMYSYDYTEEDCKTAGISTETIISKNILDRPTAFKLQLTEDPDVIRLLKYLRNRRINTYEEKNTYYSQFLGIPRKGQEILISNKDKSGPLDPEYIPLHKININDNPLTYEYVFVNGLIEKIKNENPSYYYLRFLDSNKLSIYRVRNTEQFDVLSYDNTIFTETEITNFFKIYNSKKLYMQELMYVEGFNSRMPSYPFLMEILLLQDVFMSFFNSYMDNFALANYTDQEIYDILDSYNLSNLKKVKMGTLRKIIRDLPDLIELRGSDLIIEKILDIVADESVTIKRYYLAKEFKTDERGEIKIDTEKTYEDNIDIIFKEKIIRQGSNKLDESGNDYDTFVADDDTWGGNLSDLTKEEKTRVKQNFKRELKQIDFSQILTKYLTISSTVNSYTKQVKVQNLLGLLWQYLRKDQENNFMTNDVINFNSYDVRPIDLYAAICWLNQFFNGVANPEYIRIKNMNIANIISLRDTGVENLIKDIESGKSVIKLPKCLGDRTAKEVIKILGYHDESGKNTNTDDDIWPYYKDNNDELHINYRNTLISFNPNATISELFNDYNNNIKIINALKEKWINSSTLEESKAWEYLIEQNQTNVYYEILFDNEERFDEFIKKSNREFGNYLNLTMNNINEKSNKFGEQYQNIYNLYVRMLEAFRDYMLEATENNISLSTPNSEENDNSVEYLNDLKLLFNEFLSIYTELHKIEYSQVIDDSPYNRIKLLYHFDKDTIFDVLHDNVKTEDKLSYDKLKDDAVFYKYTFDMLKDEKLQNLNESIESIKENIENIGLTNRVFTDLEVDNLLSFAKKQKEEIEEIMKDTGGSLTDVNKNRLEVYNKLINLLINNDLITLSDVLNISSKNINGKTVYEEYAEDEIEEIKRLIKDLDTREDILPHFKTFVESFLYEAYTEKIILIHRIKNDEVGDYINEKIYLDDNITKELIESFYKDSIKTIDFLEELDISYTMFLNRYMLQLRYTMMIDELSDLINDKVYIDYKTSNDNIDDTKIENIAINHFLNETDISFTTFVKDLLGIEKYIITEVLSHKTIDKVELDHKLLVDEIVQFIKRDSLKLNHTIKEIIE